MRYRISLPGKNRISHLEGSRFSAAPFILFYLSHSTVTTWRLVPESFAASQDYCLMCVYPPSALTVTTDAAPAFSARRFQDCRILTSPWGADNTQKILDVLSDYGVKCTFFVVGNWADQYPEQAKAIVESGNELMNHSNAHDHYNSLTADQIIADVNTCNDKIEALTGIRPTLIRCPFGEYDDHVVSAIRSIGMEPIQWDVERYHIAKTLAPQGPAAFCIFGQTKNFDLIFSTGLRKNGKRRRIRSIFL